ncbi:Negative elongation factor A [Liparis tanakae]|uniref:Negative elongation factor A n=2 Tax=Percomorphaceae TaxID=1489872 RepID=A0A4Z2I2F9_9TELE|nr:Negative elongation factor A [Liparis tanakae]
MRVRRRRPPRRPLFPDNGSLGGRGDVVWIFSSIQRGRSKRRAANPQHRHVQTRDLRYHVQTRDLRYHVHHPHERFDRPGGGSCLCNRAGASRAVRVLVRGAAVKGASGVPARDDSPSVLIRVSCTETEELDRQQEPRRLEISTGRHGVDVMASMKDSDTGLWLHNKLGSTDELWTPPSIASLLTVSVIDNIRLCFSSLSPPVKLKLLLGMLHLPRRTVDEMKEALSEIIQLATVDSEPWVLMVADILKSFPETGSLNLDLEDQNPNVQDILGELREKVSECEASAMLPLECQYLNKSALTTLVGPLTPPVKHFQLKRKPKSATLRAELLQKSPLKGIPKAPFRSPTAPSLFSPPSNRTPIAPARTPLRKERGVKLLDISELDMVGAGREAKRRRKTLANAGGSGRETLQSARQPEESATAGAGATATLPGQYKQRTPMYNAGNTANPATPTSPSTPASTPASNGPPAAATASQPETPTQPPSTPQTPTPTPTPVAPQPQPKKNLSLTRDQMYAAQEMFKTANKVTRPEKALILGFMAGSRENPCPEQGDIIQIKLSEHTEVLPKADGTGSTTMLVDTVFEMNYSTGQWTRLKKYKPITNTS